MSVKGTDVKQEKMETIFAILSFVIIYAIVYVIKKVKEKPSSNKPSSDSMTSNGHLCSKCNEKAVKTEDYLCFDKIHPKNMAILQGIVRLSRCRNCIEKKLKESESGTSALGLVGRTVFTILLGTVLIIIAKIVCNYMMPDFFSIMALFIFGGISWAIKEMYSDYRQKKEKFVKRQAAYNTAQNNFDDISFNDIMDTNNFDEYLTLINIPQAQKLIENNISIEDVSLHKEIFNPLKPKNEGHTRYYLSMKKLDVKNFEKEDGNGTSIPEWLIELYEEVK